MSRGFSASGAALALAAYLLVAGRAEAQPPAITPGTILNAASLMPPVVPAGKLAPGMRVVMSGIRFVDPGSPTTVEFTQGAWHASVTPSMLEDRKLEVTLPGDTPLGDVGIAVRSAEGSSGAEQISVQASIPGIWTLNREGWGPAAKGTFRPGDSVTLAVNGLNEAQPKVFVAGAAAGGVQVRGQEVTFEIPSKAPTGCWTPVWLQSMSGAVSNFATISTSEKGGDCRQAAGWFGRREAVGTRTGLVVVEKIRGLIEQAGKFQDMDFDSGAAFFFRSAAGDPTVLQLLPPESACLSYAEPFSFTGLTVTRVQQAIGSGDTWYDAGPRLSIVPSAKTVQAAADNGSTGAAKDSSLIAQQGSTGYYAGMLGGVIPFPNPRPKPLVFFPGKYSIHAEGGKDLGPFDLPVVVPAPFEWLDSTPLEEVDRQSGVKLEWSGLGRDRQMVAIAFHVDLQKSALASTICLAPRGATSFRIPAYAFANFLPTSGLGTLPLHFVVLASIPAGSAEQAPPSGLDDVRAMYLELQGKSVRFR